MATCSVLIVDDGPSIVNVVAAALQLEGYDVATARNGKEGLAQLNQWHPDLVLLDMRMPVMDGWAFAEAYEAQGWQVPIVVMTAAARAQDWCDEIGADCCLPKPFDIDDLLETVARCCADPPRGSLSSGADARA
jgi:CheY-like chemotaxis protein